MKKICTRLIMLEIVFIGSIYQASCQEASPGQVSAKIYSNFHYGIDDGEISTAMEITRAYFGYSRQLGNYFSAEVKLDIGSPDDISEYSRIRRYAYFKNAGITFSKGKVEAWAGLFDMLQFKTQEKFWGYRYLYKSYMDEYRFGPSADLGLGALYQFTDWFSADFILSNGEGYSSPQRDNTYKAGWGFTLNPTGQITLRAYYAIFTAHTPQMTFSGFAGYETDHIRLAAEYNHQKNYQLFKGHDRYGYSTYATWVINPSWEIFGRYDQVYSNLISGSEIPWNLPNDGSAIIGGIQFTPHPAIHLALDYQDWLGYASNGNKEQFIYLHVEAIF